MARFSDFQYVARAEIVDAFDFAVVAAFSVAHGKSFEIRLEILILFEAVVGQRSTRNIKADALQRLRRFAAADTLQLHDHDVLGRTHRKHREGSAVLVRERTVFGKSQRIVRIGLGAQLAAHPVRGAQDSHQNHCVGFRHVSGYHFKQKRAA